ncbi:EF-hand calcium-binding domain-containing protein 11-like isoform X2 [Mercenaria mercenaria]|uniref:EF-hand calcium-binding domain-containing protein 11-like isoform X2 n=1 Tax=Mercenaria mercenaria TaxID=6596 RepID=UPI00234E7C28|nr:EF-hand calcium-binding domain-containing protein 11-like isoform X2 [Mercenaria mercenaria]
MSVRSGFSLGPVGYTHLKRNITKEEESLCVKIFHGADEGRKGYLSRTDLKVAMVELLGYKPTKFEVNHLLQTYGEDIDDQVKGRGFLTLDDVKKVFSKVAPHVPEQTVHSAFREIDQDGDGRVSYKDFEFLMKYNTDDHI